MKQFRSSWVKRVVVAHALLLGAFVSTSAFAALSVNPIFRSNMVLQRNTTVPVFGTATIVGNTVQVTSSVAAPRSVRYGMSAVGNLFSSCNVPSEGGTLTITQLPASLFQLDW